jgi:hypothetical protein
MSNAPLETVAIEPGSGSTDPLEAYRAALRSRPAAELAAIREALGGDGSAGLRPAALVEAIVDRLDDSRLLASRIADLSAATRLALGVLGLTDALSWPAAGLELTVRCLGSDLESAVEPLLRYGLLVRADGELLVLHPSVLAAARTVLPDADQGLPVADSTRQVREADGLEPILRLAALWQVVDLGPLRHTQQGSLYKRDRDRLEDDSVLAGPIADALEPLPDMATLWLALARGVGLVVEEIGTDRLVAAPSSFWGDHAVHLPQMLAMRWLGLRTWHELRGSQEDGAIAELALPFVRPAILLWLATLGESDWVALDDLAARLDQRAPSWDRLLLRGDPTPQPEPKARRSRARTGETATPSGSQVVEAVLLGPAYQFGLVRAAEESPSGRRVVQLTPLGRYALALGPPPPPRSSFEQFLYVQPNFEVIAYRQGLSAALIGQLSRFARWTKLGAALELKLTAESVYRGLEGGLDPAAMNERLARHSVRPLPAGVAEALRTWAGRRQQVTYHASATLMEFATTEARDSALAEWTAEGAPSPSPVGDRLLLVEDERTIPFHRFRLTGSRDYRRPPEICLTVEPGGVVLALDPARADLFIEAELTRFAEELPRRESSALTGALPARRFRVTRASILRAVDDGHSPASLARWFARRAGADLPPAIRLLLHATNLEATHLRLDRMVVLSTPSEDLLDGLLQHPETRDYLGERLGPTAVAVAETLLPSLHEAARKLGLALAGDP